MPVWGTLARNTPKVSPGSINNASQASKISNLDLRYDQRQFLKFKSQLSREYPSNVPIFLSHENCN